MINLQTFLKIIFLLITLSCSKENTSSVSSVSSPNILFIIADDLGKDALKGYTEGVIKPKTTTLDSLRENGLLFTNFCVNPTCTPTRGSIITGKYGYKTGVKGVGDELNSSELVIQKYINDKSNNKYATAVIGKWHLSGNNASFNPETFGIDYYAGLIRGAVDNYYNWQLTNDGETSLQTNYITQKFTDLAIDWISNQTKPWFLWLAYTAPHTPFHVPPSYMHHQGDLTQFSDGLDPLPYYMAAIEAMDFEIGRLLNSLTSEEKNNTVVVFIGDNGTPGQVTQSPFSEFKVKNTLYQGGINTPLIVCGKDVINRGINNNLLNGTDLFCTFAEISGLNFPSYQDSKSFKKLFSTSTTIRNYQYSELKNGNINSWSISNGQFKLIQNNNGDNEMYHLIADPYENTNLLSNPLIEEHENAKLLLETELAKIRN